MTNGNNNAIKVPVLGVKLPGSKSPQGRYAYSIIFITYAATTYMNYKEKVSNRTHGYTAATFLVSAVFMAYHVSCLRNGGCNWYSNFSLITPIIGAVLAVMAARKISKKAEESE
mgnify:CR=1 FL=1